jgi:uncharacterized protein (TIGR02217 family)
MAFHHVRFPLDIALGAWGGPERRTEVTTLAGGGEKRNGRWAHSRRRYNAGYGVKSRADMQAVLAFFEERRGRLHGFLWRDGLDHSSGGAVPQPNDQPLGTGDGTRTSFQLVKTYGAAFDPYLRPITKPVAGSVRVAVDGVEALSGWVVDVTSGQIGFDTAPEPGASVSAGFLFDVPVRFDTDRLEIELNGFDGAEVPNIPLVEILP